MRPGKNTRIAASSALAHLRRPNVCPERSRSIRSTVGAAAPRAAATATMDPSDGLPTSSGFWMNICSTTAATVDPSSAPYTATRTRNACLARSVQCSRSQSRQPRRFQARTNRGHNPKIRVTTATFATNGPQWHQSGSCALASSMAVMSAPILQTDTGSVQRGSLRLTFAVCELCCDGP